MGIVLTRENKPFVFEVVSAVRYTRLDRWIARGDGSPAGSNPAKAQTGNCRALTLASPKAIYFPGAPRHASNWDILTGLCSTCQSKSAAARTKTGDVSPVTSTA